MQRQAPPSAEAPAMPMSALRGTLKPPDGKIPSDEEIKEMIVEHLLDKYT